MAVTEAFSGSATMTTNALSLTTNTTGPDTETSDGVFQLFLDVSAMASGDEYKIEFYEKVRSADSQRLFWAITLMHVQSPPIFVSPAMILLHGWDMTVDKIAGTDRTMTWSIRKIA